MAISLRLHFLSYNLHAIWVGFRLFQWPVIEVNDPATITTLLVSVIQWRHEQDPSAQSLTRTFTRTGDLPGALCPTVPTTHQPRQHGALCDGATHRSAPQDL